MFFDAKPMFAILAREKEAEEEEERKNVMKLKKKMAEKREECVRQLIEPG